MAVQSEIMIDEHTIGQDAPVFVIAEAGVNHNGSMELACQLIREARQAGADCVKFQTFRSDRVVSSDAPKASYQLKVTDQTESQLDMLKKLELKEEHYGDLLEVCREEEILFSSTPYNEEDIAFLDSLDIPLFKAASIHCAEPRFLQKMAETGRAIILSTGMANWEDVDQAVSAIRSTGNENFVVLQCTTDYPSAVADVNLRTMEAMRKRYDCLVGYSDHTQSHAPCVASVALGARVIERHFTLDQNLPGPDHTCSDTPEMFTSLVGMIRDVEQALGSAEKRPTEAEQRNMTGMRRSIVARRDIAVGSMVAEEDLICKRPATGLKPNQWSKIVGRRAARPVAAGSQLSWDDLDG